MAKDQFSFDVVSEVDMVEVGNALDQARREVGTRFDFKDTNTSIDHDDLKVTVQSATEDRCRAAIEVVKDKMVKRGVSLKALTVGSFEDAAKGSSRCEISLSQGITDEKGKAISKHVKGLGLKVQTQIQGDQVRVLGKSKDDLQSVMASLKEADFGLPLQYVNQRP